MGIYSCALVILADSSESAQRLILEMLEIIRNNNIMNSIYIHIFTPTIEKYITEIKKTTKKQQKNQQQ